MQDPGDARDPSMPMSALLDDNPDLCLPLSEIPGVIIRLTRAWSLADLISSRPTASIKRSPARTARSRHRPHALAGSRNRPAHHRPVFASGAVCGSWFERAFARGNHQIVFEFHQPQEQRNHSRLFDEADRFVGGYPGQLPFALFGPFLKALLDPKEINLDCRTRTSPDSSFLK